MPNETTSLFNKTWPLIARHTDTEIFGFFGKYRFLSNFFPALVEFGGLHYPNSENAYQSAKFEEKYRQSFVTVTPGVAKAKGQTMVGRLYTTKEEWDLVKYDVMWTILYEKFSKNKVLRVKLLETFPKQLIEANWWGDTDFGHYVPIQKGKAAPPFGGRNNLGRILMEVREALLLE